MALHLVEDDHGPDASSQRFFNDEFCLLERPLIGIHQQHRAIHHAQYPAWGPQTLTRDMPVTTCIVSYCAACKMHKPRDVQHIVWQHY